MAHKRWSDLSSAQQFLLLTLISLELSLTATAAVDLARRPAAQVKGHKAAWAVGLLVQPVGPIAYLLAGRRKGA